MEKIRGSLEEIKNLETFRLGRHGKLYHYFDGRILKTYTDIAYVELRGKVIAQKNYDKLRGFKYFKVPNGLYYVNGELIGVLYDEVLGDDLKELMRSDDWGIARMSLGLNLARELEKLHKMGLIWGDVRLGNIIRNNDEFYGIDTDDVHKPEDDNYFLNRYYVNYATDQNANTDNVKYLIAMLSYALGFDLEKYIWKYGIYNMIAIIKDQRGLEFLALEIEKLLSNSKYQVFYEDIVDSLSKMDDFERERSVLARRLHL